jgi:hypothetical protein
LVSADLDCDLGTWNPDAEKEPIVSLTLLDGHVCSQETCPQKTFLKKWGVVCRIVDKPGDPFGREMGESVDSF